MLAIRTKDGEVSSKGSMSFTIEKIDEEGNIICKGNLLIEEYLEEIFEIESERYIVKDIDVIREDFGTDDINILYQFSALDWKIKY